MHNLTILFRVKKLIDQQKSKYKKLKFSNKALMLMDGKVKVSYSHLISVAQVKIQVKKLILRLG
jgi:hypothetical protein